jgi:CheY-like chemotaxis protein
MGGSRLVSKQMANQPATAIRVLLVEDHRESLDVLARLMDHWGFEVSTADTLTAALALITAPFDAIICDIGLPDGTGYALISEAKRQHKDILAIALTGYGSPFDIEIGKQAGFDHHLTKPFDCEKIRSLLATLGQVSAIGSLN